MYIIYRSSSIFSQIPCTDLELGSFEGEDKRLKSSPFLHPSPLFSNPSPPFSLSSSPFFQPRLISFFLHLSPFSHPISPFANVLQTCTSHLADSRGICVRIHILHLFAISYKDLGHHLHVTHKTHFELLCYFQGKK